MKRANRRRLVRMSCRLIAPLLLLAPIAATAQQEKAAAKKRPHTDSRTPFVHRIQVRDAQDNPITVPKESKDGKPPHVPVMAINTTCGKCHDYPAITKGWHMNMADPAVPAGRPGEPWILTDEGVLEDAKNPPLNTRTQLPISYRKWPGTWLPSAVGLNDWKFAYAFARQHPGGGILETSKDQRFNVTGTLANDCLVCHVDDNSYDPQARYEQLTRKQNFKYATLVASGVGSAERSREKLKDNWNAADGPSEPPFEYDLSRFNAQNLIHFDLTRRVQNERCYTCHTSLDTGRPGGDGPRAAVAARPRRAPGEGDAVRRLPQARPRPHGHPRVREGGRAPQGPDAHHADVRRLPLRGERADGGGLDDPADQRQADDAAAGGRRGAGQRSPGRARLGRTQRGAAADP